MAQITKAKKEMARIHCNGCGHPTKHHVLFKKDIHGSQEDDDYGEINWADTYQLLECAGCEKVTMRHTFWFEPTDDLDVKLYPPPVARKKPAWVRQLPEPMRVVLEQVYAALDSDSRALALMGARAVADMVLVEQVGDKGTFSEKLRLAQENGVLAKKSRDVLAVALDAGSAAAHRGYQPKPRRDDRSDGNLGELAASGLSLGIPCRPVEKNNSPTQGKVANK